MTPETLDRLGIDQKWYQPLLVTFDRFEINNAFRQAAFIGQCGHESGGFKTLQENLNYGAAGLRATWPKRFQSDEEAQQCARQPEKIANKVYADRMGNGDSASGDGWKYRGRGLIQLTGKSQYASCMMALDIDCLNDPDLLLDPKNAALSAGWFWSTRKLNYAADLRDTVTLTKLINGGQHGLADREARTERALAVLAGKPKI